MVKKKYTLTAPRGSSERLALEALEELLSANKALLAKLDADTGVTDTDYATLAAAIDGIQDRLHGNIGKE